MKRKQLLNFINGKKTPEKKEKLLSNLQKKEKPFFEYLKRFIKQRLASLAPLNN